jgi:hypothetical protein
MARIRTIKPEFTQSESIGRLSRDARLLFIQIWTIVDDSGRARASSRGLASALYPFDDDARGLIDEWLRELQREQLITRYEVGGSAYLEVINWRKHQKIDRPSVSRLPSIDEASRVFDEGSTSPRCASDAYLGPRTKDSIANAMDAGASVKPQVVNGSGQGEPEPPASSPSPEAASVLRVEPRTSSSAPPEDPVAPIVEVEVSGVVAGTPARADIWGAPLKYLTSHGVAERHARSMIGKWLKGRDHQSVFDAITQAQLNAAVDPVGFITKFLNSGAHNGNQGQYRRTGASKQDAYADLKAFQRQLEERECRGREGAGEVIDI